MQVRFSWLATAVLLLGVFIVLPEEGSAATKKSSGSLSLNFTKIEFDYLEASNPGQSPPVAVANIKFNLAGAHVGPPSAPGPVLPTATELGVFDFDSFGVAHAGSQDVFFTGAPASFPAISSYHLTMDFTLPGSTTRGLASALQVTHDPAAPGEDDHSFWEASAAVAMPGAVDYGYDFIVEANPDQPGLSLKSVQTAQAPMFTPVASSFFDVFVELNFDGSTPIDPSKPLLWLTTSAVPEPGTASLLMIGGAMLLRRWR